VTNNHDMLVECASKHQELFTTDVLQIITKGQSSYTMVKFVVVQRLGTKLTSDDTLAGNQRE